MTNVIHITDLGLQAANNAKAGGVLVDLIYFKIGNGTERVRDTDTDIRGETLYRGNIHLIEVTDTHATRFTFEMPAHAIPEGGFLATEIGLYLNDDVMFGRCVFQEPYYLHEGRGARIHALLVTTRVDHTVINVTLGELSSLPATPNVSRLPLPDSSEFNTIVVHDLYDYADGTQGPGTAIRTSGGGMQWAFSGFERVYSGQPCIGGEATARRIFVQSLTQALRFRNGEIVVVYVVAGPGRGQTRKMYYESGTESFVERDNRPFDNINCGSTVVIWRRLSGSGAGGSEYPPPMANIPPDWTLVRGVGNLPVWAPPPKTGGASNTLYTAPGRMRISALNEVGTGSVRRYPLGDVVLKDVNHCIVSIGGVTQHKSAYDVTGSELEFADDVPSHASIDFRMITKEPGSGTYTNIVTDAHVGDGARRRFSVSEPIESSEYAFVHIRGLLQATTAYTYDPETQEIVFVSPPQAGLDIEISSFVGVQDEGYSTKVVSTTLITVGQTLFIELPIEPQSKDFTFVSVQGTHIHRDLYSVVDNKVVLSSPVRGGLEIEVSTFVNERATGTPQTNLSGVVTDAVMTAKSIKLLRHNAHPIQLPIPAVHLTAGPGIRIAGEHPSYRIESTIAERFTEATHFRFSTLSVQHDSEEIIYTHRINLTHDLMLHISVDFAAILGPGFMSVDGMEMMQYVIGFRTTGSKEPEYGRDIKGTGEAGFSSLSAQNSERAFSNASLNQVYDVIRDNIPAGYIDLVARMRVRNSNVARYGGKLSINFNVIGTPMIR